LRRPKKKEGPSSASIIVTSNIVLPKMVVIGTSAGGPPALLRVLKSLPRSFPCPIVIAQHMATGYMAGMAQWLSGECQLEVRLAKSREVPVAGVVYLAPDDAHITFDSQGYVVSEWSPPINRFRPSVDRLFSTASVAFAKDLLAIVLSGMGTDGCEGAGKVRSHGGKVIVQDEQSSVVWGMPGAVAKANYANSIMPLSDIADRLMALSQLVNVG